MKKDNEMCAVAQAQKIIDANWEKLSQSRLDSLYKTILGEKPPDIDFALLYHWLREIKRIHTDISLSRPNPNSSDEVREIFKDYGALGIYIVLYHSLPSDYSMWLYKDKFDTKYSGPRWIHSFNLDNAIACTDSSLYGELTYTLNGRIIDRMRGTLDIDNNSYHCFFNPSQEDTNSTNGLLSPFARTERQIFSAQIETFLTSRITQIKQAPELFEFRLLNFFCFSIPGDKNFADIFFINNVGNATFSSSFPEHGNELIQQALNF